MKTLDDLIGILKEILVTRSNRYSLISKFSEAMQDGNHEELGEKIEDALADLASDMEYYVSNPNLIIEDPAYFSDVELEKKIDKAFQILRTKGVTIKKEKSPQ